VITRAAWVPEDLVLTENRSGRKAAVAVAETTSAAAVSSEMGNRPRCIENDGFQPDADEIFRSNRQACQ
jgi:hypothetical protein